MFLNKFKKNVHKMLLLHNYLKSKFWNMEIISKFCIDLDGSEMGQICFLFKNFNKICVLLFIIIQDLPQFTDLTYMGGTRSCGAIQPIFNTNQRMGNRSLCSSLYSDAIVFTTDGGQTDIAQMSQNFALSTCLQGTQGPSSLFLGVTNVLTKLIYPL